MTATIQTPLLRTFTAYYGHIGYQLLQVDLTSPRRCLNLALNLTIFLSIHLHALLNDPWKTKAIKAQIAQLRPFVALVAGNATKLICPVLFALKVGLYFFSGRKMVSLLDNRFYLDVYRRFDTKRTLIFVSIFLLVHLAYSCLLNPSIVILGAANNGRHATTISDILLSVVDVLFTTTSIYLDYYILHYRQHGNLVSLRQMRVKYNRNSLQSLAAFNRQLNGVTTLSLTISLLITIFSSISVFAIALIVPVHFTLYLCTNFVYIFLGFFYVFYLAAMNGQVLDELETLLKEQQTNEVKHFSSASLEFDLYRDCFTVQLFGLTTVNLKTLFSTVLFCISFIVFIFQTN